ncbi:MAG TPA: insulinase family protein [Bacteroidales bacterium]|nr:insulinase family protein [Bacteroidales bacterium]HSA43995.1 insulinase family protein [Bacteroidales bacterium]
MKRSLIPVLLSLWFILPVHAQLDRSKPPQPGPPPRIDIGEYQRSILDNGLTLIVVSNHKLPRITCNMLIDYDPVMEGEHTGFTSITGSLLGTGTLTRTKDQINEEIDFMGAGVNFTDRGFFASCLKKHSEKCFEIIADALINAKFNQEELEKIRKQTLSGLAMEKTSPDAISDRLNRQLIYGTAHPYGENVSEQSVESVTLEQCQHFYQAYFRPNIAYLAIVGDITMEEALPLVKKYFGSWQKQEVPRHVYSTPEPPEKNTISLVDRPVSVQSVIKVSYPVMIKPGDKNYITGKLMNVILGGGTFRLFNNLRETHGYTYGAYSQLNHDKLIGSFIASTEVRNSVTDSAIVQILYEMERLRTEKVPAEELDMVKNYVSGTFALSLEKPETIAGFALNIERFGLPADYYRNYLSAIKAVTPEDIMEAAKTFLKPQQANVVVVGKAEEIVKPLAALTPGKKIRYYDNEGKEYDPAVQLKPAPEGVTAESVNEKYLEAIGGRKKLAKMKDITSSMTTTVQGMTLTFKNYRKAPDKLLVEISMGGMVMSKQVFDGARGLVTSPMGNEEAEGEVLETLKAEAIFFPELDYAKHKITATLLGIEEISGTQAYKIEYRYPGDKRTSVYFDLASGLKIREVSDEGTTNYSDYRDVKGLLFPYQMDAEIQGQALKLQVTDIEINKKLKDELFKI